jgi:integrin beta 3
LDKKNVYRCKNVVALNNYANGSEVDYAIIELDRNVVDFQPVKISDQTEISKGEKLYTIGYPIGTTKKISRGEVRSFESEHNNPLASLDIYFGNSGGPIFNAKDELIGIVSYGEEDFVVKDSCNMPKRCTDDGCLGETLTPVSKIIKDFKK